MKKYLLLFSFCLAMLLPAVTAEVTECINSFISSSCPSGIAIRNITLATGFQGATVLSCSSNADCVDTGWLKCFVDWDGTGPSTGYTGWCNATSITSCYSNASSTSGASKAYQTGYYFCTSGSAYRQCSTGAWGAETACSGNQTCTSGTASPCSGSNGTSSSSSSSSSSGGSTTNATPTPTPSLKSSLSITSAIQNFDLIQEESAVKSLTVKNDGNKSLLNVVVTISGISATDVKYTVSPEKVANLSSGVSATFLINFSAQPNATVKSYAVTTEAGNSDAKASATFTLRVLPSNATVAGTILPLYDSLKLVIGKLELNITELEKNGVNTTTMKHLLADIKDKLNQTAGSIEKKDYFAAAQLLENAKTLIADLQSYIAQAKAPGFDFILVFIIVIVIVGVGALAYLMWPAQELVQKKAWKPDKEESMIDRVMEKLRRKKEGYVAK